MREIFAYETCRAYLRAAFEAEQAANAAVTLTSFAKALGMGTSSFHMILTGKRNLTVRHVQTLVRALRLTSLERDYFETLFLREHADDRASRAHYRRRLSDLAGAAQVHRVRRADRLLMSSWKLPVLLVYLWDVAGHDAAGGVPAAELAALAAGLGISAAQLDEWLARLRRAGLVSVAKDGRTHLVLDGIMRQIPQQRYLGDVLAELGRRLSSSYADPEHVFRAFTFSIERSAIAALKGDLLALFEAYMAKAPAHPAEAAIVSAFAGVFPALLPLGRRGSAQPRELQP